MKPLPVTVTLVTPPEGGLALGDTDDSTDAAAVAGHVIVYRSFLVTGDGPEAVTTRRFTVSGPWAGTLTLISPDDTTRTAFQPGCRTSPSAVNPAPRTVTHAPGAPTPGITDTTSGERRATVLGDTLHSAMAMAPPRALRNASDRVAPVAAEDPAVRRCAEVSIWARRQSLAPLNLRQSMPEPQSGHARQPVRQGFPREYFGPACPDSVRPAHSGSLSRNFTAGIGRASTRWTMGVWSVRCGPGLPRSRQRRQAGMCGGCGRVGCQIQPRVRASWTASWRLAVPSLAAAEER
jgi:hypothetical protein